MSTETTIVLAWTDATGTTWRVCRGYSRTRQQWEATIESKAHETWFRRETMVLDGPEVFTNSEDN